MFDFFKRVSAPAAVAEPEPGPPLPIQEQRLREVCEADEALRTLDASIAEFRARHFVLRGPNRELCIATSSFEDGAKIRGAWTGLMNRRDALARRRNEALALWSGVK